MNLPTGETYRTSLQTGAPVERAPIAGRMNRVEQLRLLVIEDDADQRELIRETVEDHFGPDTVTTAGTLAEALDQPLIEFDLILADYNLPDSSGLELLEAIRGRCRTPIIMVTGENVGRIATEAIRRGATDYIVKLGDYLFTIPLVIEKNLMISSVMRENDSLRQDLEIALQEVRHKNGQLEQSLKRVEELAATDPLTGLYNRRHFGTMIDRLVAEAQRYGHDLSCVMIDLDGYKKLNDTYGHQVGDQLLVAAGKVILANMRRMDVAARYGGDEFVLLLPHADSSEASAVVQRIRLEFRQASAAILRSNDGVTMSVGIASIREDEPAHADQLLAAADIALYDAKAAGRNRIKISAAELAAV
jgi:two-component system, cell cycle response regulator